VELSAYDWALVALCSTMIGLTKVGIPGFTILAVPLMAMAIPAKQSVGALLGILMLADMFAVVYHRRNVQWGHILRLMPATLAGILAGFFGLQYINDEQLKPIIGVVVLLMLVIGYWRSRSGLEREIPSQLWFAAGLGFFAGVTTMMANAAGPVMIIYLLAMGLPKAEFVGTRAWFFFIINWIKVPFGAKLGLITAETVKLDLMMLPFIVIGAFIGVIALKRIGPKSFKTWVQFLAAAAAIKLLF